MKSLWVLAFFSSSILLLNCDGGFADLLADSNLVVVATEPADGATDVAADSSIRIEFNQAVDSSTISEKISVGTLAGEFFTDGNVVTFVPANDLPNSANIAIGLDGSVVSAGGNLLGDYFEFSFATADPSCRTYPTEYTATKEGVGTDGPVYCNYDDSSFILSCNDGMGGGETLSVRYENNEDFVFEGSVPGRPVPVSVSEDGILGRFRIAITDAAIFDSDNIINSLPGFLESFNVDFYSWDEAKRPLTGLLDLTALGSNEPICQFGKVVFEYNNTDSGIQVDTQILALTECIVGTGFEDNLEGKIIIQNDNFTGYVLVRYNYNEHNLISSFQSYDGGGADFYSLEYASTETFCL